MEMTHVIFDLDGTLIDSRPEIELTYRKVVREIVPAQPVDFDQINYGQTLPAILQFIYGEDTEKIRSGRQRFIELYDNSLFEDTHLYDGVEETLKQLKAAGFLLHIATNKRIASTLKILEAKHLSSYFTGIITSDKTEGKVISKQDMVTQLCDNFKIMNGYMIGDGDQDIEAGKLNGLITVAALYGYEKKEILFEKKPIFVINQFKELTTILLKNI